MRGGIVHAHIGFDFHDASRQQLASMFADQDFAQEFARDAARVAVVKPARQRARARDVESRIAHRAVGIGPLAIGKIRT